jgi:uncharacterized phage protein (TIGR02218 family)
MKTVSAGFKTMLASSKNLMVADLYTLTLLSGTVLYYTDAPQNITYGGNTYVAAGYPYTGSVQAAKLAAPNGTSTTFALRDQQGNQLTGSPTVTAVHRTQYGARQKLYATLRTNLAHYSGDFTDASWQGSYAGSGSAPVVTPNYAAAPDGSMSACRVQLSLGAATGDQDWSAFQQDADSPGTPETGALWIKANGPDPVTIYLYTLDAVRLATVTNQWQLVEALETVPANQDEGPTSGTADVLVWHPEIEAASEPGVYIPTTSGPASATDYAVTGNSLVLAEAPAAGSALDWDGSGTFGNTAPGFARGPIKLAIGLQVESLEVDILYDADTRIMGKTPGAFANAGGFDGARIKVDKFLTASLSDTTNGIVNLFTGVVANVSAGSGKVNLSVSSDLVYLSAAFPRNYFLPQCNHALFDAGCTLAKATYAVAGTTTSGTATTITATGLTQAAGYFAQGYVVITSGANAGLTRSVKDFSAGVLTLLYPLPGACAAGDTFTAYPGCDKLQSTCSGKFANLAHFRGFPYVPTPEVIELGQNGSAPASNNGGGAGIGPGGVGRGSGGQSGSFKQL